MNAGFGWALLLAALFCFGLIILIGQWPGIATQAPPLDPQADTVFDLGAALVSPDAYVIPFEVASVLLLAALIGALVVARPQKKSSGGVK